MNKTQDIIAKNVQLFKKDVDYLRNCGIVIYISGCRKGKGIKGGYQNNMLKFDEQKQIDSVKGALALRGKIEEIVDQICKDGFKNICWLGIGGTYASCLQAEVHMKEKSGLDFFVENAAEYLTTGN